MSRSAETSSSTRTLSDVARHLVKPSGIVKTGWRDIESTCGKLGTGFDRWQADAGRLMFAKTANGQYAATVGGVGMSIPRQVGKTHLVGYSLFALCVLHPGLTVIWTAHHSKTAGETLLAMQGMARRQKVAPYVHRITTGNGDEAVWFHNGSRILFGARERGFGRGFAGVDVLVFDEAQILTDRALDAMLATMNTAPNGLALFMGTPPLPTDPSEAFRRMRTDALSGESDDVVWIEFGADPDSDPDDRKQWAKANPSYPHRTPLTSMLRLRKKLSPESWMREGLGIWDEEGADIFAGAWPDCVGPKPDIPPAALAVACSVDLTRSAVAAAVLEGDRVHVKPLRYGPGMDWVTEMVAEFALPVVVDGGGPGKVLVPDLDEAGVDVRVMTTPDVLDACAEFWTMAQRHEVRHESYKELDEAVLGAVKRPVGDRWAYGRRKSVSDVTVLEAATFAAWGALHDEGGPNVHIAAQRRVTLVAGPADMAEAYVRRHAGSGDLVVSFEDFAGVADWVVAEMPQPWERDRFRVRHNARVVVVTDEYRLSKYGAEELNMDGGG